MPVKNLVVGQKLLISKRGCIMGQVIFLKAVQGFLKKKENCIIAVQ